jgi:hypothetical protein
MTRERLDWSRAMSGTLFLACCGEEGQGRAVVEALRDGSWRWRLDMLPADPEPAITGHAATAQDAIRAVECQVGQWPALIEGAVR